MPENEAGELTDGDIDAAIDDPDAWRDVCDDPSREDDDG
jgi:hypothetical protein